MNYEDFWKVIRLECYPLSLEVNTVEFMTSALARSGFGIKISFGRNSSPAKIFRALSEIVTSFQQIDSHLLESINLEIEPMILLEDIEQGSIIAWFKTTLESLKDEDVEELKFKKIGGVFLNRARYAIVEFAQKKLQDKEQLKQLQQNIIDIAEESEVRKLVIYSQAPQPEIQNIGIYSPINSKTLLSDISNLQTSLSKLDEEDQASYLTAETEIFFNRDFNFSPEIIDSLLTKEVIESQSEMILKIKKPDYLGESKWEFKHESKTLLAKINDQEWLLNFKNGEIDIRPGASLRVSMNIIVKYDDENEVISTQYEITKVLKAINSSKYTQTKFPENI